MIRLGLSLFAMILSIASQAQAQAHEPTDAELAEARHSFDVATHAFETGDYETAVSEFRAALELSGAADLYFNIYLSEEREGNLQEAADALDQYLQHGTIEPEQRTLLIGRLQRLRARIAAHTPSTTTEEQPETLHTSPIATTPEPTAAPEPQHEVSPPPVVSSGPPVVGIALLAVAGALAINFGIFAGLAFAESDRLGAACGHGCVSSQVATLNTYDIVADVSWISAALIGATGLVLLLTLPPETHQESAPRVALAPWAGPSGAGLAAGGRF